ncbi:hypothetical protein Mmc1_0480 [Magnetococcus marinus MC-1]|uniref:Uncharacterized protein n=1 Tax=Magnetococcus marinus (strain ATCC BAA-1437 / JCM 17883 / MC-1) TaxID=156889 RepID=A0L4W2_MAGMM|nr:hypothetical protein Mmc1_0480 [Magnetococcus marinus MC-1]
MGMGCPNCKWPRGLPRTIRASCLPLAAGLPRQTPPWCLTILCGCVIPTGLPKPLFTHAYLKTSITSPLALATLRALYTCLGFTRGG